MSRPVEQLLSERQSTHGDFELVAAASQDLKNVIMHWDTQGINYVYKECMDMICVKLARALRNPAHKDHWEDIAGYAMLALRKCNEPPRR